MWIMVGIGGQGDKGNIVNQVKNINSNSNSNSNNNNMLNNNIDKHQNEVI
jgi:hypothetical protein